MSVGGADGARPTVSIQGIGFARCPSPDTLWCAVPRTPPRPSITVVVTVRLCGSEPTTLPASASVMSTLERATPRLAIFRFPPWLTTVGGPADYIPVGAAHRRFYQVRPVPKARTEADTSDDGHPVPGDQISDGSGLGPAFDLREPSPTFGRPIQHRDQ